MKSVLALLVLAGAVVIASLAADAAPKKGVKSLDPAKGYFHQVHNKNLKMGCTTCHGTGQQDVLFLRRADVVPASMSGQVDRKVCLGCHKAPAKPAWYGLGH